jgi:hypothetical protein
MVATARFRRRRRKAGAGERLNRTADAPAAAQTAQTQVEDLGPTARSRSLRSQRRGRSARKGASGATPAALRPATQYGYVTTAATWVCRSTRVERGAYAGETLNR